MNPPTYPPPQSCGLATTSAVLGFFGLLTGFFTGIPAVITGHLAHGKIRKSGGTLGGAGLATTGLVMGYLTTFFSIVFGILAVLAVPQIHRALKRATMAENVSNARQVKLALDTYAMDNDGRYPPDLQTLVSDSFLRDLHQVSYMDHESKGRLDWIYYPGYRNTDDVSIVLLASPETIEIRSESKRIVCHLDSSTLTVPEADYQQQVRDQAPAESE